MFGVPNAFYLGDDVTRQRESQSRRPSVASAAVPGATAAKTDTASGNIRPESRIPSRATSRRPSVVKVEEESGRQTPRSGGLLNAQSADEVVEMISRSFASFLSPSKILAPPAPARPTPAANKPSLVSTPVEIPTPTSPTPSRDAKGKGKAKALPHQLNTQDLDQSDNVSVPEYKLGTASTGIDALHTKGKLLFCKSQVFVHPSKKRDDNIPGYLGLASVSLSEGDADKKHENGHSETVVLFWIPSSVTEALNEETGYQKVSRNADNVVKGAEIIGDDAPTDISDDYILVTIPPATVAGHLPASPREQAHRPFSPSPVVSSPASRRASSLVNVPYPSVFADNNDNSHTDASSLLLVSEGGDLLSDEFAPDGERGRDVSGGESAHKIENRRRNKEMEYAWSVPMEEVYSILVYAPSIGQWYGSVTFNLLGGISMPSLYFHDEESPSTIEVLKSSRSSASLTSSSAPLDATKSAELSAKSKVPWGATPLFSALRDHAELLRSRLEPRLFLVNPSRTDREVHAIDLGSASENDRILPKPRNAETPASSSASVSSKEYPPRAQFPDAASAATPEWPTATFVHPTRTQLLSGFSQLTQKAKRLTQDILSQPFAEPLVPHLPGPVRGMVQPSAEWENRGKKAGNGNVAGEFESARVYLARWARVVAEEGERSRKAELASKAKLGPGAVATEAKSDVGIFELVRSAKAGGEPPKPTRIQGRPVTLAEVEEWHAKGLGEVYLRKEVFRRGLVEGETRRYVWEVLLGVIAWEVGLGKPTAEATTLRKAVRDGKRVEYERLKAQWQNTDHTGDDSEKEEWHRIDVDCRRTDRDQPMFAVPETLKGQEEKEGGGAGQDVEPTTSVFGEAEEGSQTALNPHVAALRTILMTYHVYSPELGYVQGMSDLLSPIYLVYDGDESESFWAFCGWMKVMDVNFLRDQSGMRQKLSTLQQLIHVMDPQLYRKLERTNSTSMFICFRWLLIAFKREFKFMEVIKLWDVLFTSYYSDDFQQFIALGVLQSHRDVIIRYLVEADEVLKYCNQLSETIDLESTIAQAETLFLSFRSLVEEIDRNELVRAGQVALDESNYSSGSGMYGMRKRRGSTSTVGSEPKRDLVSDDLRDLLAGWGSRIP